MEDRTTALVVRTRRDLLGTSLVSALNADGFEVTDTTPESGPALLLVDLDMPDGTGAVGRAAGRGWTVIGLASDDVGIAAAVAAGAAGYFLKSGPLPKLTDLLRGAAAGRELMDPVERERLRSQHVARERRRRTYAERLALLSRREREVLRLLDEGLRASEIAERLFLSVATIRTHIQNVLHKLEAGSQNKAVAIYRALR